MNSKGRIYLQKRSKFKEVNPGCYDKTLGGHIGAGQSWDMTLIKECAEELGFPATVVPIEEFDETVNVTDLSVVAIFKKVDYIPNFTSQRKTKKGDAVEQPWMTTIYFGYYDGGIRFVDGESTGIEVFSLEELEEELKNYPGKFTEDVKLMITKYRHFLKPVEDLV